MKQMVDFTETSPRQQQFLQKYIRHRRHVSLVKFLILLLFLLQWEVTTRLHLVNSFIFSSPSRPLSTCLSMIKSGDLIRHIGITLGETLFSFLLVTVFSITVALLLWYFSFVADVAEPYLVVLNSLPKSALAPLLIVWLGANQKTIIVAGMSVAIFGTILNLYTGFRESGSEKARLIYTLGGKKHHVLTKVILPSNIPSIISIMKVDIGLCLVGVIIGEFMGARRGLGYLIIYSSQVFQLTRLIMAILILCVIAMVLYGILSMVEKRVRK